TTMGEHQLTLRLAVSLWWFWLIRGHLDEGRRRLAGALAGATGATAAARAEALYGLGRLTLISGSASEAWAHYEIGLQLAVELGDARLMARLLNGQARVLELRGDLEGASQSGQASLAHARA